MRVSVVIPTRNEASALTHVLADLPGDLVTEVIVVDSNSTDGTPEVAARMGARVVHEPRRGYGQACLTGIADANAPDVIVFLDGDYSDRPAELPQLLAPIVEGRADITIGSRLAGQRLRGAMPWHAALGNRMAAFLINALFGQHITDLGPFRAARAEVLRELGLEETTYGWAVEMIVKGAIQEFRVVEVPVSYFPRIGKSKISGTARGTIGAAWFIFSRILRYSLHRGRGAREPVRSTSEIPPCK
jgi:glycosyltransferase involved in cell wall biosynthesis